MTQFLCPLQTRVFVFSISQCEHEALLCLLSYERREEFEGALRNNLLLWFTITRNNWMDVLPR